jgi:hypothetical protein
MIEALVAAAIAGITALKKNRDAEIAHQNAINEGEQQLWDQRNAAVQAKIDRLNGKDPRDGAFDHALQDFRQRAANSPVPQDWTPLVNAAATGANAIYKEGQRDRSGEISDALAPPKQDIGSTVDDALASYDAHTAAAGGGGGAGMSEDDKNQDLLSAWQPVGYDDPAANDPANLVRKRRGYR